MKSIVILGLLTLCVAFAATMVLLAPGAKDLPVALTFATFTNTPTGPEALFWFSNRVDADFTFAASADMSLWTPTGWAARPYSILKIKARFPAVDLLAIPVESAGVPTRVSLRYSQREPRLRRLQIWWTETRANWSSKQHVYYSRYAEMSVTGETAVSR